MSNINELKESPSIEEELIKQTASDKISEDIPEKDPGTHLQIFIGEDKIDENNVEEEKIIEKKDNLENDIIEGLTLDNIEIKEGIESDGEDSDINIDDIANQFEQEKVLKPICKLNWRTNSRTFNLEPPSSIVNKVIPEHMEIFTTEFQNLIFFISRKYDNNVFIKVWRRKLMTRISLLFLFSSCLILLLSAIVTIILYLTGVAFTSDYYYLIYMIPLTIVCFIILVFVTIVGVIIPRTIERRRYYSFRDQINTFIENNIKSNKYLDPYIRMEMKLRLTYTTLFGKNGEFDKTSEEKSSKIIPHLILYGRFTRTILNTEANIENISYEEFKRKSSMLPPTPKSMVTVSVAKFERSPNPSNVKQTNSSSDPTVLKKKVSFRMEHDLGDELDVIV